MEGVISAANSSTTPLAAAGVFTGTYELVLHYTELTVSIYGTHASAANGVTVEWSHDGSTTMLSEVLGTCVTTSPTARVYSWKVPIKAAYARVVYTNGGTLQTTFNLQTIYHYDVHATGMSIPRMGIIEANGQFLTPVVQVINITTATTTSIVSGSTGVRHYVLGCHLTCSGANTIAWLSAANVIISAMSFAANGQFVVERGPYGFFMRTNSGEALQLTTTAANNVRGTIITLPVREL